MLTISIFRSIFTTQPEQTEINEADGRRVCEYVKTDWNNAVVFVNGFRKDKDYVLADGDVCTVRCTPSEDSNPMDWVLTVATGGLYNAGVGIASLVTGKGYWETAHDFQEWLFSLEKPTANNTDTSIESIPTLAGAKNQSGYGKPIPLAFGRSMLTPYYCGSPYRTISGEDGEKQTYHALYMLGYNDIQVEDIKLGVADLASNSAHVENGSITIDGRWNGDDYGIKLELRQDSSEVSLYPQKVIEEKLNIELLHPSDGKKKLELERFSAKNPQRIQVEFTLNGLIGYSDKGEKQEKTVSIQIKISFDGGKTYVPFAQISGSNSYDEANGISTIKRTKNKVMRFVAERPLSYDEAVNCKNRTAEIYICRDNAKDDATNTADTVYLSGIRTWVYDYKASTTKENKASKTLVPQRPVIESRRNITARLGFQIDADETEFRNQIDALNAIITAKGRTWDGSSWSSATTPNSNPASMLLRLLQHKSRGRYAYQDARLDMESLGHLYKHANQRRSDTDSTPKFQCNGMLTTTKKTREIVDAILKTARAKLVLNERKYGAWIDEPGNIPVMVLNNQNILSASNSKEFKDLPDGYKIKFLNKDTWQTDEITVLYDQSKEGSAGLVYEQIELLFQTDAAQVYQNGKYFLAVEKLRPEVWNRKVSVDGNLLDIGSLVEVQDDTILVGIGDGAEIKEVITDGSYITAIRTDGNMYVDDLTKQYGIRVTCADGTNRPKVMAWEVSVTKSGEQSEFIFKEPIYTGDTYKPSVGDIVSFGEFGRETTQALCFGKKDNGDGTFDLTLVPYQEGIYTADSGEIPEFDSKVTDIPERSGGTYTPNTEDEKIAATNARITGIENGTSGNDSAPDIVSGLAATATKDGVVIAWNPVKENGLRNTVKQYTVERSKDNGTTWAKLSDVYDSSLTYTFDRTADGYPEKEALLLWKFRVTTENIYGNKSAASAAVNTDVSGYLTWIPQKPTAIITAQETGLRLLLAAPDMTRLYGTFWFYVTVSDGKGTSYNFTVHDLDSTLECYGSNFFERADFAAFTVTVWGCNEAYNPERTLNDRSKSTYAGSKINASVYKGWKPANPVVSFSGQGRHLAVAISNEERYGELVTEVQVSKDGKTWYEPNLTGDPYASVENWKKEQNKAFSVMGTSFYQKLPLETDTVSKTVIDTAYYYRFRTVNATAQKQSDGYASFTFIAQGTGAQDVVKNAINTANIVDGAITALKIYVENLAAITANLGKITNGSLEGSETNKWNLDTGEFRVGNNVNDFFWCKPIDPADPSKGYNIQLHASKFEITAIGTIVRGAFYVSPTSATVDDNGVPSSYYFCVTDSGVTFNKNVTVNGSVTATGNLSAGGNLTAGASLIGRGLQKTWTTLDLSGLDATLWYPVTFYLGTAAFTEVECYVSLNSGTKPSWSTHTKGFTCHLHLLTIGSGWSTTSQQTVVLDHQFSWSSVDPTGWTQMSNSSTGVLWLRGGGKYYA